MLLRMEASEVTGNKENTLWFLVYLGASYDRLRQ